MKTSDRAHIAQMNHFHWRAQAQRGRKQSAVSYTPSPSRLWRTCCSAPTGKADLRNSPFAPPAPRRGGKSESPDQTLLTPVQWAGGWLLTYLSNTSAAEDEERNEEEEEEEQVGGEEGHVRGSPRPLKVRHQQGLEWQVPQGDGPQARVVTRLCNS